MYQGFILMHEHDEQQQHSNRVEVYEPRKREKRRARNSLFLIPSTSSPDKSLLLGMDNYLAITLRNQEKGSFAMQSKPKGRVNTCCRSTASWGQVGNCIRPTPTINRP